MAATTVATRAQPVAVELRAEHVFDCVRAFLVQHRLSPDPLNYDFAHRVVTEPGGPLASSVRTLTEGGIRLSARDIETLGGKVGALAVPEAAMPPSPLAAPAPAGPAPEPSAASVDGLMARTQMQVEGFADMMLSIRAETRDFGRDLAASADAMRDGARVEDVVRLTTVMLDRVRTAETRLAAATNEASELRAKLEEARGDARRDPLTGLPNRRAFEEAFTRRCGDEGPFCLAVCDVDRFKRVNDLFGHAVGDRVLKAIATALTAACGDQVVARYGGEEFAVLVDGPIHEARLLLDAAREAVAARRYRLRESDQPLGAVTFSAGLTVADPCEPLSDAFARADRSLYAAKEAGRNRIVAD